MHNLSLFTVIPLLWLISKQAWQTHFDAICCHPAPAADFRTSVVSMSPYSSCRRTLSNTLFLQNGNAWYFFGALNGQRQTTVGSPPRFHSLHLIDFPFYVAMAKNCIVAVSLIVPDTHIFHNIISIGWPSSWQVPGTRPHSPRCNVFMRCNIPDTYCWFMCSSFPKPNMLVPTFSGWCTCHSQCVWWTTGL